MEFKDRLKILRMNRNIKQEELADIIGVTRNTIVRWERGDGEPRLSDIIKLSQVLNVSTEELVTGGPGKIELEHGPLKLKIPATEEGYTFLEEKLKEFRAVEKLPEGLSKAG